jgi:hypothetical protein
MERTLSSEDPLLSERRSVLRDNGMSRKTLSLSMYHDQRLILQRDKYHGNKAAKPTAKAWNTGLSSGRVFRKIDAQVEATTGSSSDLSRSLLELLPQNTQYTSSAITTALLTAGDEGVLYSFDSVKSPGEKGRKVDLGGLVEQAEKKFLSQQTERMVKESYEVLDVEGESVVLTGGKKKKGSPKTKAVKFEAKSVDEDDGFELV